MSLPNERVEMANAGSTVASGKLGIGFLRYKTEKAKYGSSRNSAQHNSTVRSSPKGKSLEPPVPDSIHGKAYYSRRLNSIEKRDQSTIGQGLATSEQEGQPLSQSKIDRYRRELRRKSMENLKLAEESDQQRLTHASLAKAAERMVSQFPEFEDHPQETGPSHR